MLGVVMLSIPVKRHSSRLRDGQGSPDKYRYDLSSPIAFSSDSMIRNEDF